MTPQERGVEAFNALKKKGSSGVCSKCGCYDMRNSVSDGKQVKVCRNCGNMG